MSVINIWHYDPRENASRGAQYNISALDVQVFGHAHTVYLLSFFLSSSSFCGMKFLPSNRMANLSACDLM